MQNHKVCRYRTVQNCKFLQNQGQCKYKHEDPKEYNVTANMQPLQRKLEYRPKYQPVQNSQSIQESTSSPRRMQQNVEPPISDKKFSTQADNQQQKYVRRDARPMQEEERTATPKSVPQNKPDQDYKSQKLFTRPCKYGESCKDFKNNRCNFLHEEQLMLKHTPQEDEEEKASPTYSSLPSNRSKALKQNFKNIEKEDLLTGAASMMRNEHFKGYKESKSKNQKDFTKAQTSQRNAKFETTEYSQSEISGIIKFLKGIKTNETPNEEKSVLEEKIKQLQRMQVASQSQGEEEYKQQRPLFSRQHKQLRQANQERVSFFSYQFLKDLQDLSFDDLKMKLHGMGNGLIERLNGTELKIDSCLILLEILEKLLKDRQSQISLNLLSSFVESKFADNLLQFLKSRASNQEKKANCILKVVKIMIDLIDLFPSQYMKFPVDQITIEAKVILANQQFQFKDRDELEKENNKLLEKYIEVRTEQDALQAQNKQGGRGGRARLIPQDNSYLELPATDFKEIDIIPGEKSLREQGKVRKMPEKGDLLDSHNYLDLLFRMLHEDAITDLRNGIQLFKRIGQLQLNRKDLRNKIRETQIKYYENMTIDSLQVIDGCGCLQFRLPMIKKKFVDWRICKKLLPGSLVILSHDRFNTLFIALLMNTDAQERNKTHQRFGYVAVNIQIMKATVDILSLHELHTQYGSDSFQMIESTAYFESYKHVLQQMKDMDTWLPNLDISKFLIHGKADMVSPPYIEQIFDEKYLELNEQIQKLQLDQSQLKALQSALTYELALIQGPPGTGKTYLGVQLVKILLHFKDYWCKDGPILLVTYTNHALNQFLLHVSKFTEKIARIGGRSPKQDEEGADLERFNIRNLVRAQPFVKGLYKTRKELEEIKHRIAKSQRKLLKYQLHFITTLLSKEECEFSPLIINRMKEDFPAYLKNVLQQRFNFINQAQTTYILDEIKFLRDSTNWNILVVFWLGIIDLVRFVEERLYNFELMNKGKSEEQKKREEEELKEELEQKKQLYDEGDKYDEIERELDFERQQVGNDENVDQIWNAINDAFKIETASPDLVGVNQIDSLQDLLQLTKTPFDENDDVLQVFSNAYLFYNLYSDCPLNFRWQINNYLIGKLLNQTTGLLDFQIEKYKNLFKVKEELENLEAKQIIKKSLIVAMTTTGRAKYSQMLKDVNFPIIIVEEAAEVFEAHIVASLSQHTQHLVLIGDHEQLRPNPAVYDLSFNFNLSMSMFERLIKNELQHSTLDVQRRMRPEIAQIVKFIYPTLQDHEIVGKYPHVKGLNSNIFFFDHQWPENTHELMQSKFNTKEAEMAVRFAFYLLQQKYKPSQITILTLYTGQLLKIKSLIRDSNNYRENFRGVRVTSVDNYQGEENDIIILSLVRSNPENKIGFLKITNRVCVALSRAKQGLFIFGNSKCLLGSKVKLWEDVVKHLQAKTFIGNSLIFKCVNHDNTAEVKDIADFAKVPEGGCTLRCNVRIPCGHTCERMCHPYEKTDLDPTGHESAKCKKQCARTHDCGHPCSYKCFECKLKKMDCMTKVEKSFKPCNHTMVINCCEYLKIDKCRVDCEKILLCGHKCKLWCSTPCNSKPCKESVERKLPCGHTIDMDCYKDPLTGYCYKECGKLLECGHPCPNKCGDCQQAGHHGKCKQKCTRNLVCGHVCQYPCTKNCPPCKEEKCLTACSHSKCSMNCSQVCILCTEKCGNKCEHSECTKLCSEPCNKPLCNESCKKLIPKCGHPCIGMCGEDCPQICRVCKPDDQTFQTFFGEESEAEARFIQIDCGHVFEVFGFDKYMAIKHEEETVQFKKCPFCKAPIMKVRRYMNQINSTLNDINAIKALMLKQDLEFKNSVAQTREELKQLLDKLSDQDKTFAYFKTYQKVIDYAKKRVNAQEEQRSSTLLNELIDMIPFFSSLFQLAKICYQIRLESLQQQDKKEIELAFQIADDYMRGTKISTRLIVAVQKLTKYLSDKYQLSQSEIKEILKATGLGAGHWNKCPNGHFYVIGDCGGAMEQSRCPDCKAVIGGRDHALAAGNSHARELDDEGRGSAWNPQGFDNMVMRGNINLDRIVDEH